MNRINRESYLMNLAIEGARSEEQETLRIARKYLKASERHGDLCFKEELNKLLLMTVAQNGYIAFSDPKMACERTCATIKAKRRLEQRRAVRGL